MAAVGTVFEEAAKGGKNRLSLSNARVVPPSRRMSLPNLKDVSSRTNRANCQIPPARPVLKDKGNLPKECLRPLQRPPEKQDCRKGEIGTEVKACASGKPSLVGSLKPRRNSTGEIGKNLYSYFEKRKMEATKRSKVPLDSTWVRKDSDGSQKMEDSVASHESSTVGSECGSSIGSAWSRTFVVLDNEGNEVFPDTLVVQSHGRSQDENVVQDEVPTAESSQHTLNGLLLNSGPTVTFTFQHQFPTGVLDTISLMPKSTYFPDCRCANPSMEDASSAEYPGSTCNYFSTPVASTKPKSKMKLTPVMEVDLELSSTEPGSATKQKPCNLPSENQCVRKRFPDLLQHTTSSQDESTLNTPLYQSYFAVECMEIVSQLEGGATHPLSSDVSTGPQSAKRKRAFDCSTIDAEPLPYDLTPMKSMLSHDADKVIQSLDNTPALTEGSFFCGSILDLDNMNLQLLEFGDEDMEDGKPLSASKEALDSEPSGLSKISLASSGSFRGLKDLPSFEGLDVLEVAPGESASICSLHESVDGSELALVDSVLNCTVDLHVPASSALLNTVTHTPVVCSDPLANGPASNAFVAAKQDAEFGVSQDLNLTITKAEKLTAMNKTLDRFVTTLEVATISPYNKKSETKVIHLLNTTQDIRQTRHLESTERNMHVNVTQDIVLDADHVNENLLEDANSTRDVGDNHQDLGNEGFTTSDLGASKHQNLVEGNAIRDLADEHQDLVQGNPTRDLGDNNQKLEDGGNATRDLGDNHQDLEDGGNTTRDLGDNHQDLEDGGNTTRDLGDESQSLEDGGNTTRDLGDNSQHLKDGGNTTRDLRDNHQDLEDRGNTTRDLQDIKHKDLKGNATRDIADVSHPGNLGVVNMTKGLEHQDLDDRRNVTIETDTPNQETSKLEYSANATRDLHSPNNEVNPEDMVNSHATSEKILVTSKASQVEEVVSSEANLEEVLGNGEAGKVVGENEEKSEETVKCGAKSTHSMVKSDDTVDNVLVKTEAKPQDIVMKDVPTPEVLSNAVGVGLGCSANARSSEAETESRQRPLDRLSSGDSSVVLHPADSSRKSIELTHNESCFSAGSLSFVTSTPLPGAAAFQFTKGSCSDSMQSNASSLQKFPNLSICSVPEESDLEVSEESQRKSTTAKKSTDRTGKSIGKSSAISSTRISNLQRPSNSSQRNLSRAEVPSRTMLPSGIPAARRSLALTSTVEKPRVSRETLTKLPVGGARIPTMTKTTSRSSLTNGKTGLPKPGMQTSTQKPTVTSSTNLLFEVQKASSSVLGEQSSKNEEIPPPGFDSKLAQVTFDAGNAQPVKPLSMMKPPSASKLYRFRGQSCAKPPLGGTRASNRSIQGGTVAGEKSFVEGTGALDSRPSMAGPRPAEDRMSLQAQRATDSRMSMGPPRNPEIRMPLRTPRATDTRVSGASGVPNIRMSLGPQQSSDSKMNFVAPRDPDFRMVTPRGPESRLSLGPLRGSGSRMPLTGLRPPGSKMSLGLLKPPDSRLSLSTPAANENKLSVVVTKQPMGSAVPDSRTSLQETQGSHCAATPDRGVMLGGLRPQLYNSKGAGSFGIRPPAATGGIPGGTRSGLSVRPPGPPQQRSPASESVSPRRPDDQVVSEGTALPNDDSQAAKRKLSSLPALRSTLRFGLKLPTKIKLLALNPSPKRPRLAPNLPSEPSASSKPNPGPEMDETYTAPARLETPGAGIKHIRRSPRMFGKPNGSSKSMRPTVTEGPRTEAESVPKPSVTVEESVAQPESIQTSCVIIKELSVGLPTDCNRRSPGPERNSSNTTPARMEAPGAAIKPISRSPRISEKTNGSSPCDREASTVTVPAPSASVEESVTEQESVRKPHSPREEQRAGLHPLHEDPCTTGTSVTTSAATHKSLVTIEVSVAESESIHTSWATTKGQRVELQEIPKNPCTMEDMAEKETIHTTPAAIEEVRSSPESIHNTPRTIAERSDGRETNTPIPPMKVEMRTPCESAHKTPDTIEGQDFEFNCVCKPPAAGDEPSSVLKPLHQTPVMVAPGSGSDSLHAIPSAVEERAGPKSTPQPPLKELSVFSEFIDTAPSAGEEPRNGQECLPKTPTLMEEPKTEPDKTPAAGVEQSSVPVAVSKRSPSKAKPRTDSESFYITPPTSKKAWPTLDSTYHKTPFATAKQITESASFYKTPTAVDKLIHPANRTPVSDRSRRDLKKTIPPWMMTKQRNGPHTCQTTPATEEKLNSWMESSHETTLTESVENAGAESINQTTFSYTPSQNQNIPFVLNHSSHTEPAAIHQVPSKNVKTVIDENKIPPNTHETVTERGTIHRMPQNTEKPVSSGTAEDIHSNLAHSAFDIHTGERNGTDSMREPIQHSPTTETAAANVSIGELNTPGEPTDKQPLAPATEGCTQTAFPNSSPCHEIMEPPCSGKTNLDQELEEVKRELAARDLQCEQFFFKMRTLEAQCEKYRQKLHILATRCECQDLELSIPSPSPGGERPPEGAFKVAECSLQAPGEELKKSPRTQSQEVEQPLENMTKVEEPSLLILRREVEKSPRTQRQEVEQPLENMTKVEEPSLLILRREVKKSPRTQRQEVEQPLENMTKVEEPSLLILGREVEKSSSACCQAGAQTADCSSQLKEHSLKTPVQNMETSSQAPCKEEET